MSDQRTVFDVVAVGDTTQDVFLQMSDASVQCDLDGENCKICFDYADKIAVEQKTDVPAVGNAANNAIGISRLGLRAALYTVVGDDVQGHLAADVLRENRVDTRYVVFDKKHGTNFSAVINFQGERTILVYHEPRDYQLPAIADTRWLYVTSAAGEGVTQLHEQVLAYLGSNSRVRLAFNPGTHQMHLGLAKLRPLLTQTEILFLNREETAELFGAPKDDMTQLVREAHAAGVKNMVLTDGPAGAYASDGKTVIFHRIFPGPVLERTGAGDSYGAGFLAGVIRGLTVGEAMMWGNANATSVVQYIGARQGLLDEAGVRRLIAAHPEVRPEVFATL
ncbi:MAG: carbohydrate kinase family protein [Candidatus Andersenbacteria bacterium]|nr:carbohydrate kinase family protein [Candidatus Andersenbacteria bacterium]